MKQDHSSLLHDTIDLSHGLEVQLPDKAVVATTNKKNTIL